MAGRRLAGLCSLVCMDGAVLAAAHAVASLPPPSTLHLLTLLLAPCTLLSGWPRGDAQGGRPGGLAAAHHAGAGGGGGASPPHARGGSRSGRQGGLAGVVSWLAAPQACRSSGEGVPTVCCCKPARHGSRSARPARGLRTPDLAARPPQVPELLPEVATKALSAVGLEVAASGSTAGSTDEGQAAAAAAAEQARASLEAEAAAERGGGASASGQAAAAAAVAAAAVTPEALPDLWEQEMQVHGSGAGCGGAFRVAWCRAAAAHARCCC